jgi:hypothetical protein
MKKKITRIFKILLILLFIICSIIFTITTYFADEIEKSVISKIQQNMEAPLILENVAFTIYDNFPYASVKITNLLVLESKEFNNDTLLFAKRAYIELSLFDLINKVYDLQSIIVTDAKINIKYSNLNTPNFLIFKKESKNKNPLSIQKITLLNTDLTIKKGLSMLDLDWNLTRSIISINNNTYTLNINSFSKKLAVGITDYMNAKKIDFTAKAQITKDKIKIVESNLDIEDILLKVKGNILNGNMLDLEVTGKDQEINQIITHLPENIKNVCTPFIANGKITFNSVLKGLINKENNPLLQMEYEVLEGNFKLRSIPFELNNISMNGKLSNGKDRNFNSTKIVSNLFKAKTKKGNINGQFILSNLNNYFLNSQFESSWDLTEVNQYFKDSPFIGLRGKLFTTTNYKGNITFDNRFKKRFLNANHKSDIRLENIKFNYQKFPLNFSMASVDCKIKNHKILITSYESTISETDFNFKGEVLNLIAYILDEAPKIYIDGGIKSTYTNFTEVMTLGNISKNGNKAKRQNIMPDWVDANTNIDIKNFSYENFIASNLSGAIEYENNNINGSNLYARSLNGEITGSFILNEPIKNNLKLVSNITLKKINIRNSFDAFNNYGQTFISKEQLKGVGTAELNIESHWNNNFVLDAKKLKVKSHLTIEKGELIDFKPLENLSSYVSLDELKHVTFSTLENTIDVANEMITIPNMEIKSSALSVFLSGTHTFNQEIDYEVTLLLSELLSTSFRKKNTKITEFGEEKKDGKIFNTVYLKMKGNTDDPKISLNKIRFMEDVNNSVKKEKETIINIIKEDILQTEERDREEKGQEIEIDWRPEL